MRKKGDNTASNVRAKLRYRPAKGSFHALVSKVKPSPGVRTEASDGSFQGSLERALRNGYSAPANTPRQMEDSCSR
jgi:hypothetical protein